MSNTTEQIPHPPIATAEEWHAERQKLLKLEKEHTRQKDRINAQRRRLPMVPVTKNYTFTGPEGPARLLDLFDGKRQLLVYHFMFGPDWEKGCPGCTSLIDATGRVGSLASCDSRYVLVSRAPLEKLEAYKKLRGWDLPWYSSGDGDFNYDYHVSFKAGDKDATYNFAPRGQEGEGEGPGISVFFRIGEDVYHANSVYARGLEGVTDPYSLLDLTPYGRQEDFEDSPEGWPQKPTYG